MYHVDEIVEKLSTRRVLVKLQHKLVTASVKWQESKLDRMFSPL
jgi:hypothetical protein